MSDREAEIAYYAFSILVGWVLKPFVVMLLWNAVLVDVVTLPTIGFWHALGLLLLVSHLRPEYVVVKKHFLEKEW